VDERGRAVPSSEAGDRVLLTIFNRRTQPLIRYEVSDVLRPLEGNCECGRPFRLIESIEGRVEDVLYFPARGTGTDRVAVHPNVFHHLLETVPASGWQVIQNNGMLSILLTGLADASLAGTLAATVRRTLEEQGAVAPSIHVRPVDALQRGATGKAPLILRQ
jgi:phenylacetate-CoA ligase